LIKEFAANSDSESSKVHFSKKEKKMQFSASFHLPKKYPTISFMKRKENKEKTAINNHFL